jgi:hypothetical protein
MAKAAAPAAADWLLLQPPALAAEHARARGKELDAWRAGSHSD